MRIHRQFRSRYARNPLFIEWRQNSRNPLYSQNSVDGLLLVYDEPDRDDIYLSEVQQFIYYIGERNWPLNDDIPEKVVNRFKQIWTAQSADRPSLPFPDPGERWDSDPDSDPDDFENQPFTDVSDYNSYMDFLNNQANTANEEEDRQSVDFLEEPDVVTPDDLMAYFQAAEEAGLRSQGRRRGRRREQEGQGESTEDPMPRGPL